MDTDPKRSSYETGPEERPDDVPLPREFSHLVGHADRVIGRTPIPDERRSSYDEGSELPRRRTPRAMAAAGLLLVVVVILAALVLATR